MFQMRLQNSLRMVQVPLVVKKSYSNAVFREGQARNATPSRQNLTLYNFCTDVNDLLGRASMKHVCHSLISFIAIRLTTA